MLILGTQLTWAWLESYKVYNLVNITCQYSFAYPCSVPGIDACKDPGEAFNVEGISKYEIVKEVGFEMIMRLTRTKSVLRVQKGAIVLGQSL